MATAPPHIGPYALQRTLGRGGMGVVYEALDERSGERVALKTVNLPHNAVLNSLRREIHVLSQLQHPGVVRILDSGVHDGLPWYAMELLLGRTLRNVIDAEFVGSPLEVQDTEPGARSEGAFEREPGVTHLLTELQLSLEPPGRECAGGELTSTGHPGRRELARPTPRRKVAPGLPQLAQLLTIVRRICSPLAYLHGEGIVHRDLKPENIFFRDDGMPVLLDFGLTFHFRGADNREALQIDRQQAGSVNYMAPEQLSDRNVDARADLYALGCILYELLTGTPPFAADSQVRVSYGHLFLLPTPPSELVPGLAPELDRLVLRLLAKQPEERLGYAEDLSLMLAWFGARGDFAQGPHARAYVYRSSLVGRKDATTALLGNLGALQQSRGGMTLLVGEAGSGRTRLVHEVAQAAVRRELLVLTGQFPHTGGRPLEGLRRPLQTVADLCRERGESLTRSLIGPYGGLLAMYEPAIAELPGLDPPSRIISGDEDVERQRLGMAFTRLFHALTSDQLVVLVLDDLQWADALRLEILTALITRGLLKGGGLRIFGTCRSHEQPPALERLCADAQAQILHLRPLEAKDLQLMLQDMLATPQPPESLLEYLVRHADGNPFFVAEYLRTALEEGVLFRDPQGNWQLAPVTAPPAAVLPAHARTEPGPREGSSGVGASSAGSSQEDTPPPLMLERLPLPRSIEALLRRRIEQLPEAIAPLAMGVAAVGRPCPIRLLGEISAVEDPHLFSGCQELLRRHVLEESSPGTLRFVQESLREAAYLRIPADERPPLHQTIAEAVERLMPDARTRYAAFLGHHWELAQRPEVARARYQTGAEEALRRLAPGDAERLLKRAILLVQPPDETTCRLRNRLGCDVLRPQGRLTEAVAEHTCALREARSLGLATAQASSLYHLGQLRRSEGLLDEARALIEEGLALARSAGASLESGMLLGSAALLAYDQGQWQEARSRFEEAIELLEPLQAHRTLGTVLSNYATCLHALDALDEALPWYTRAIEVCQATGTHLLEAQLLTNLGSFQLEKGALARARASIEAAIALHRALGHRQGLGASLPVLAMFERLAEGDLEAAEKLTREGLALLHDVGGTIRPIFSLCELGHIALAGGKTAAPFLQEARERLEQLKLRPESAYGQRVDELARAETAWRTGEPLLRGSRLSELAPGLRQALLAMLPTTPESPPLPLDRLDPPGAGPGEPADAGDELEGPTLHD